MNIDLDLVLAKVKGLSVSELLTLKETIQTELQQKQSEVEPAQAGQPRRVIIPGAYRRSREEIEAQLATLFTPEEMAQIGKTDFSKIPIGPKSASEMINEDREDRF